MKRLLPLLLALALGLTLAAKKQRTGPARVVAGKAAETRVFDTIFPAEGRIRLAGYDKANASTSETFFITNLLADSVTLSAINVTFTYTDMQGRMLHSATHTVRTLVPPGQTRAASVKAWDRNHSFHYHKSTAPARRRSTPYRVSSTLNFAVTLAREK